MSIQTIVQNGIEKASWSPEKFRNFLTSCTLVDIDALPDINASTAESFQFMDFDANEYETPVSLAEARALEVARFLSLWNAHRKTLYNYKQEDAYLEIFSQASVDAIKACQDNKSLLAAISKLEIEKQPTGGFRDE